MTAVPIAIYMQVVGEGSIVRKIKPNKQGVAKVLLHGEQDMAIL